MNSPPAANQHDLLALGEELLWREAGCLDDGRWDDWLALFVPDCEYWVPAWRNEEILTCDPQTELSHIYYASRAGLEDRIVRIRSRRSPASTPMPRSTHLLGKAQALEPPKATKMRLRTSWVCHVFFPRTHEDHAFFGSYEHELVLYGGRWLIAKKKVTLRNDHVPTMLDVYCI